MPHSPIFLAAVGKGMSSPLNHIVHFGSFRLGKNWQGDNLHCEQGQMFYNSAT